MDYANLFSTYQKPGFQSAIWQWLIVQFSIKHTCFNLVQYKPSCNQHSSRPEPQPTWPTPGRDAPVQQALPLVQLHSQDGRSALAAQEDGASAANESRRRVRSGEEANSAPDALQMFKVRRYLRDERKNIDQSSFCVMCFNSFQDSKF